MRLNQIIAEADNHIDYTGIDNNVIQQLSAYKPHYQQLVITQIKKGENYNSIIDAVNYYIAKIGDNRFQNILKKYTTSPKNILSLSLDNIKIAQRDFEATYNRLSKKERNKLKSDVLVDRPGLKIVKFEKSSPDDVDAAKALSVAAKNTQWCVCNIETAEYYLEQGPLYLLTVNGERYLCHVESQQLMDVYDQPERFSERFCVAVIKYIPGFGLFCNNKRSNVYKQSIIYHPKLAYVYAHTHNNKWPEAEPYIMRDPEWAYNYARNVIKGRWPEAEPHIVQDPQWSHRYAHYIIKGRWPEAEPHIMKDPQYAYYYALHVIKGRWPEAEPYIMKNPQAAYYYTINIIKGRWREAESYIIQNPQWAYEYANNIIMDRWREAEPTIIKDPLSACNYARFVISGRWLQAEPTIMRNQRSAYLYAIHVIKGEWPEAESTILNSDWANDYKKFIS